MSQAKLAGSRVRLLFLILGLICWLPGIFWIFSFVEPVNGASRGSYGGAGLQGVMLTVWDGDVYYAAAGAYLGLFLLTQWFFLAPRGPWRLKLSTTGRPLWLSIVIASLLAAMLSFGLIASLSELPGWWKILVDRHSSIDPRIYLYSVLAVCWIFWAIVFFIFWRSADRGTQFGRMLRALFAGSVLELLVAGPIHVWILNGREEKDCYCVRGSYTGLVFGGTVLLWVFGPGIMLYCLREKERRAPLIAGAATPPAQP